MLIGDIILIEFESGNVFFLREGKTGVSGEKNLSEHGSKALNFSFGSRLTHPVNKLDENKQV